MQLKLTRSQRDGGIVSKTVFFCLDARVQLTRDEHESITRYKLGGQLIYNNEASQRRVKAAEAAMAQGTGGGSVKALAQFALARLHLCITVDSLRRGQHIECKSLDELEEAEDAIMQACRNLRAYLDKAATFDGREVLIDFSTSEPVVISTATPPMLVSSAPPEIFVDPLSYAPGPQAASASAMAFGAGDNGFHPAGEKTRDWIEIHFEPILEIWRGWPSWLRVASIPALIVIWVLWLRLLGVDL